MDRVESRGYQEIPVAWRATGVPSNLDQIVFRFVALHSSSIERSSLRFSADIVSNHQLYRVKSAPLTRVRNHGIEFGRWFLCSSSVSHRVTFRRQLTDRWVSIIVENLKVVWLSRNNATMMRNASMRSRGECWTNKTWNFTSSPEHMVSSASDFLMMKNAYVSRRTSPMNNRVSILVFFRVMIRSSCVAKILRDTSSFETCLSVVKLHNTSSAIDRRMVYAAPMAIRMLHTSSVNSSEHCRLTRIH